MPEVTDMLPVGQMTTINATGDVIHPVVYDRYIYANRSSRLRQHGDPIRGDLAIVPCKQGWFNVYPNLNIDLQEGAMNVLAGANEASASINELIYASSGFSDTTLAGVPDADTLYGFNTATQYSGCSSAAGRDVQVSAYP
jgi:hypothetical protein